MRRLLTVIALSLCAAQGFAARAHRADTSWARRAPVSFVELQSAVAEASSLEATSARPIVLLETNYYTFLPADKLQLRVTINPNGFGAPVTMYLYRENRTTGDRQYYNISAAALLAQGQQSDLFGTTTAPIPVFVPTLNDFVLFGSTSDPSELSWGIDGALGPSVAAAIRGISVKLVGAYVPVSPTALIARPEIKSVAELRNKTVGLNAYGGALEGMARLMLRHFNIDPDKDVKFLATGPLDSRFGAMKQGLTHATLGSPPIDFLGKKLGFVVLARAHELFSFPVSGLVASTRKIKERPDEVRRAMRASIKANRYIRQNRWYHW